MGREGYSLPNFYTARYYMNQKSRHQKIKGSSYQTFCTQCIGYTTHTKYFNKALHIMNILL